MDLTIVHWSRNVRVDVCVMSPLHKAVAVVVFVSFQEPGKGKREKDRVRKRERRKDTTNSMREEESIVLENNHKQNTQKC